MGADNILDAENVVPNTSIKIAPRLPSSWSDGVRSVGCRPPDSWAGVRRTAVRPPAWHCWAGVSLGGGNRQSVTRSYPSGLLWVRSEGHNSPPARVGKKTNATDLPRYGLRCQSAPGTNCGRAVCSNSDNGPLRSLPAVERVDTPLEECSGHHTSRTIDWGTKRQTGVCGPSVAVRGNQQLGTRTNQRSTIRGHHGGFALNRGSRYTDRTVAHWR